MYRQETVQTSLHMNDSANIASSRAGNVSHRPRRKRHCICTTRHSTVYKISTAVSAVLSTTELSCVRFRDRLWWSRRGPLRSTTSVWRSVSTFCHDVLWAIVSRQRAATVSYILSTSSRTVRDRELVHVGGSHWLVCRRSITSPGTIQLVQPHERTAIACDYGPRCRAYELGSRRWRREVALKEVSRPEVGVRSSAACTRSLTH